MPTPTDAIHAELAPPSTRRQLEGGLDASARCYRRGGLLINAPGALLAAWLVWPQVPLTTLAAWLALMVGFCALRNALLNRGGEADDAGPGHAFLLDAFGTGFVWGIGTLAFLPHVDLHTVYLLLTLVGCLNAVALVVLGWRWPALPAFLACSSSPVFVWLVAYDSTHSLRAAVFGAAFATALLLAARVHSRLVTGALEFVDTNERLLSQLASAYSRTSASHADLEQEVAQRRRSELLLSAERQTLDLLAANAPLHAVLQALNDGLESAFPRLRCSVLLLAEDGRTLGIGAAGSLPEAFNRMVDGLSVGEGAGSCGTAAVRGTPVLVDDILDSPLWADYREVTGRFGLAACWSMPIHGASGGLLGTFAVYSDTAGPAGEPLLGFMHRLSALAGIAIERARAHEALRLSEQRFRDFAGAASDWFWEMDEALRLTWLSERFRTVTGIEPRMLLGQTPQACAADGADPEVWRLHLADLAAHRPFRNVVYPRLLADGTEVWVSINGTPVHDAGGRFRGYRGTGCDITERVRAERDLRTSEARFRQFAECAADWLWEVDAEHRFVFASDGFERSTGLCATDLIGRSRAEVLTQHVDDRQMLTAHLRDVRQHRTFRDLELHWRRPDGVVRHLRSTGTPVFDERREFCGYRGTVRDVTEQQLLLHRISYQAAHDSLTGLVNRSEFEQILQRTLEAARGGDEEHVLCYLDLDQFKVVNDTCGHVAGDEMLRRVAGLLKSNVRADDIVARLGGDEFALLWHRTGLAEATHRAESLCDVVNAFRFCWEGKTFGVGVSIGVTSLGGDTTSVTTALSAADSACYVAKEQGRQRVHVYAPGDSAVAHRHGELQWVARLTRALEEQRFELAFQPIVALGGGDGGLHYEVLLRLRDEDGSLVPPGAFLGAAERYNLSVDLDRWVLSHALDWLARNQDHLSRLHLCAINLSGPSLADERFLAFAMAEFARSGISGAKVCFEITETAAIANLTRAVHFIESLRDLGCSFALDDFGSGLSSFAYLKTLPVDYLKIDGVFVRDIAEDAIDRAMVRSINEIGHVMGKRTIAEFVESEAILKVLEELGVDYAQGYHCGRPAPLDGLAAAEAAA